jgi:hypothetical protein
LVNCSGITAFNMTDEPMKTTSGESPSAAKVESLRVWPYCSDEYHISEPARAG